MAGFRSTPASATHIGVLHKSETGLIRPSEIAAVTICTGPADLQGGRGIAAVQTERFYAFTGGGDGYGSMASNATQDTQVELEPEPEVCRMERDSVDLTTGGCCCC